MSQKKNLKGKWNRGIRSLITQGPAKVFEPVIEMPPKNTSSGYPMKKDDVEAGIDAVMNLINLGAGLLDRKKK